MSRRVVVVPFVVAALVIAACSSSGEVTGASSGTTPSSTTAGRGCRDEPGAPVTVQYAERPGTAAALTSLDVSLPAGCEPVPAVIWVHGGGWRRGDKSGDATAAKAELAHDLGAAFVATNYRLSAPDNDVRWPDHGQDVAAAVAWVHEQGPTLGIDPGRIVLMGHSAGGHLVSIVATDPDLLGALGLGPDTVDCVVSLDTEGYDLAASAAAASGLVAAAFGTDPAVVADASPLVQVERNGAPPADFLVVTRGSARRVAMARRFADAVTGAGGVAEVVDVNPYRHDDASRQLNAPGETKLTRPVAEFIGGCLDR